MRKFRLWAFLFVCLPVLGQNIRWDSQASTTTGVGQLIPVLAIPGAQVSFYTGCSSLPCSTKATTYVSAGSASACPSTTQVVWQLPESQSCTSSADTQGNFGGYFQPGAYQYTVTVGTTVSGPYEFNVGGGGGAAGVASIDGFTGAFTFTGPGVSCSATGPTCTFTTGSGGVGAGTLGEIPFYNTTSTVLGDPYLSDTTANGFGATAGQLLYTGGGGIGFSSIYGGNFNLNTSNASSVFTNLDSQINLTATTSVVQAAAVNPGQVTVSTKDTSGMNNAANIDITATEIGNGTNTANLNLSAIGGANANSGNFLVSTYGSDSGTTGGNIILTANGGPTTGLGGNINLVTVGQIGLGSTSSDAINLNANSGYAPFTLLSSNFNVQSNGSVAAAGSIQTAGNFNSSNLTPGNCLQSDGTGNIVSTASPCGSGGGGGGIGGSGTGGVFALFTGSGSSTTIGNGHLDDGNTTTGVITSSEPVTVADGSGTGGALIGQLGTPPTAGSSLDTLWADSGGRWKMNNSNSGAMNLPGVATAGSSAHCVQFAANGIDLQDAGAACGSGGSGGTPTKVGDSGAGTSPTISIVTGSTDLGGWVSITTGASPAASAGVVTISFGNTYSVAPRCSARPANVAASALSGTAALFVAQSTSSSTNFVITVGSTALAASTTYVEEWQCVE